MIKHAYFSDLQLALPLGSGFQCPVDDSQAFLSFSEVFIEQAYAEVFQYMAYPKRWVDVGCHRGYFSLYLLMHMGRAAAQQAKALLIDADPRSQVWIERLIRLNGLEMQLSYQLGLVSDKKDLFQSFACRAGMVSSGDTTFGPAQEWVRVPRLDPATILRRLSPPYDLIKVDIEGAEEAFIDDFGPVLESSQALLLEWHHPLVAGQAFDLQDLEEKLVRKLAVHGFYLQATLQAPRLVSLKTLDVYTGLGLWMRR